MLHGDHGVGDFDTEAEEFVEVLHLLVEILAGAGQVATERSFATIVAPYSGIVSARHVELGEMAVPGKPLMTGFDPGTLRVVANVPQARIAAISQGGKARIEIPSYNRWIDVKKITVVPAADPHTRAPWAPAPAGPVLNS